MSREIGANESNIFQPIYPTSNTTHLAKIHSNNSPEHLFSDTVLQRTLNYSTEYVDLGNAPQQKKRDTISKLDCASSTLISNTNSNNNYQRNTSKIFSYQELLMKSGMGQGPGGLNGAIKGKFSFKTS